MAEDRPVEAVKRRRRDADDDISEEELYQRFPKGGERGHVRHGADWGFNTWAWINNPALFTAEARKDPVIRAFLNAPFSVNFAQFKSSHAEAEYFIHKPHLAMGGGAGGIGGRVRRMPRRIEDRRVVTLVLNHEKTLAKHVMSALTIEDGLVAGQMIYKKERPPAEEPAKSSRARKGVSKSGQGKGPTT